MKMQPRIKAAVMMMAFVPCLAASAQNREQVKIKIDANVNGNSIAIDTTIDAMSDFDLHRFLSDIGLADEIGELNININDGTLPPHKYFDFDDSTLEEMKMQMQHFRSPADSGTPAAAGYCQYDVFQGQHCVFRCSYRKGKRRGPHYRSGRKLRRCRSRPVRGRCDNKDRCNDRRIHQ